MGNELSSLENASAVKSPTLLPPLSTNEVRISGGRKPEMHKGENGQQDLPPRKNISFSEGEGQISWIEQLRAFEEMIPEAVLEDVEKPFLDLEEMENLDNKEFRQRIGQAMNRIYSLLQRKLIICQMAMTCKEDGLFPRMSQVESNQDIMDSDMKAMAEMEENAMKMEDEIALLKGIMQVQDRQIKSLKQQVVDL